MDITFKDRAELCMWFDSLVHDYTHMNELPHESAIRYKGYDPERSPAFCEFFEQYLLALAKLVKAVGEGDQETLAAFARPETNDKDNQGTSDTLRTRMTRDTLREEK